MTTKFLVPPLATATLDPSLLRLKCRGFMPPEAVNDTNSSMPQPSGLSVISESLLIMVLLLGSGFGRSKMGPRRLAAMMNLLSGVCGVLAAEAHTKCISRIVTYLYDFRCCSTLWDFLVAECADLVDFVETKTSGFQILDGITHDLVGQLMDDK
jgi:hypothetical protein